MSTETVSGDDGAKDGYNSAVHILQGAQTVASLVKLFKTNAQTNLNLYSVY